MNEIAQIDAQRAKLDAEVQSLLDALRLAEAATPRDAPRVRAARAAYEEAYTRLLDLAVVRAAARTRAGMPSDRDARKVAEYRGA